MKTFTVKAAVCGKIVEFIPSCVFNAKAQLVRIENRDRVEFDQIRCPLGGVMIARGWGAGKLSFAV